jgi:excisionase family DNA binding protein
MQDACEQPLLRNKRQAAHYLGCSIGTVERLMREGLPYVRFSARGSVRFRCCDLREYVRERLRQHSTTGAGGDE